MGVLRAVPDREPIWGGRPPADHRRVLDAVLWIARTGSLWRDLPAAFGNWNSVFRQLRRWTEATVWKVVQRHAQSDAAAYAETASEGT